MNNIKVICEKYFIADNTQDIIKLSDKLTKLITSNISLQKEIFVNLEEKGLFKVFKNIKHIEYEVRISSLKLLIEILNSNEILQNIFCEKFNFNPIGNVICINWFPKILKNNVLIDNKLINEIKCNTNININNSNTTNNALTKYWMWPFNLKYTNDIFPDPDKYLIGFYYKAIFIISKHADTALNNKNSNISNQDICSNISIGEGVNKKDYINNNINNYKYDIRLLNSKLENSNNSIKKLELNSTSDKINIKNENKSKNNKLIKKSNNGSSSVVQNNNKITAKKNIKPNKKTKKKTKSIIDNKNENALNYTGSKINKK